MPRNYTSDEPRPRAHGPVGLEPAAAALERELGVLQLDRTAHPVELTPAGSALLVEARQILAQVDRAAQAAQRAASPAPGLPGGRRTCQPRLDAQILRKAHQYPEPDFHHVKAGVPEKFRQLAGGRLDVGIGQVSLAPPKVTAQLFRLHPLRVPVPEGHRLAASQEVPVAKLAAQLAPSRESCHGGGGAP